MVKIMENPVKMGDLGGFPIFLEASSWLVHFCILVMYPFGEKMTFFFERELPSSF